ncbi:MAG: hypothetical protein LBJ41_10055 [Treponema sp.]|jgi:membrane protein implicated in regulation of membrane protease activity|nr:hypothetical protein [Treponema sp.]
MISEELKNFLIYTLTSWQVIAVVFAAILYIALVTYATRRRRRVGGPPPIKRTLNLSKEKKLQKIDSVNRKDKP